MRLAWRVGTRSDVGLAREGNEDSLYAGPRLLAVADGVGGSVAGEIASSLAIETLVALDQQAEIADPLDALRDAIRAANDELREAIRHDPQLAGMGTTLTAMLWSDDALGLAQLGDSRAYRLRDNNFAQITRDQTLVQSLVDDGQITPEQALTHPRRSWILQALDGRDDSEPALEILTPEVGDRYLLCSDGLSDYVAHDDITHALNQADPQVTCDRLIDLALQAGAPDNVTCIVADVVDAGGIESPILGGAVSAPRPSTESPSTESATTGPTSPAPPAIGSTDAAGSALTARMPSAEQAEQAEPDGTSHAAVRPRSIGRRLAAVAAVVVVIVATIIGGGVFYIHRQWYVRTSAGRVAVFQGVKGKAVGLHLSHLRARTDLPVTALPQDDRQRVTSGIQASGHDGANQVVSNLRQEACALVTPTPAPTPTPSAARTATPTASTSPGHTSASLSAAKPGHSSAPTHLQATRSTPTWCAGTP